MELIIPVNARNIIEKEVPLKIRSQFVPIIEKGYKLASEALKHLSFLDWELGYRHEGYLRPIAIHYLFKQEIDKGRLPLKYTIEFNKNKSYKYLLLSTGSVNITVSQVQSSKAIARHAYFRDKLQEANQLRLNLFNEEVINHDLIKDKEFYLLLTYSNGGTRPRFINLGMPDGTGWLDKINLLKEPRLVNNEQQEEEVIKPEQLVGFKKFIQEVEVGET